jgi:hypothetical protein
MDNWEKLAATIYYVGAGAVLLATTLRFFYRWIVNYDSDRDLADELRNVHLPNIYFAIEQIAVALNITIQPAISPGYKPLVSRSQWIQSVLQHKKK